MDVKNRKINFTRRELKALKTPTKNQVVYRDINTKGLVYVLTTKGSNSFNVYKGYKGKEYKVKIGEYPSMSIDDARQRAIEIISQINQGIDPKLERDKLRKEIKLEELFDRYTEEYAKKHNITWNAEVNRFKLHLSEVKDKKLSAITKDDIKRIFVRIGNQGKHHAANRMLTLVSSVYNHAISEWNWGGVNPAKGIKKYKERARERFLQSDELPRFFKALNDEPNEMVRDYFYVCLLTGARKSNVLAMQKDDINYTSSTWYIAVTKNGESQTVPLAPVVIKIIKRRFEGNNSKWVFPSKSSKSGHLEEPKKVWDKVLKRAEIKNLRIHDLRRTLGSWQAITGASSFVIGKSLNHKSQQSTSVYARLSIDPVRQSMNTAIDAMFKTSES